MTAVYHVYVPIIADGISFSTLSTFLCTRKLGPEEVIVTAVQLSAQKLKYSFEVLNGDFLKSETQQLYCFSATYNGFTFFLNLPAGL